MRNPIRPPFLRNFPASLLAPTLAIGLMMGCMTGGENGSEPSGLRKDQGTYRIEGGSIINDRGVRPHTFCDDSVLVTEADTLGTDTIPFELGANTLALFNKRMDTLESGAIVRSLVIEAVRVGRGSGLTGLWQYTQQSYRVISGALSAAERTKLEERTARSNKQLALVRFQVRFSGNTITTFEETRTAEVFLLNWNESPGDPFVADSAKYNIAVKIVGTHEVELKGLATGEIVRLTLEDDRGQSFSSSDPTHTIHHYSRTPKSCPNQLEPEWYWRFLAANEKPGLVLEKRGAPAALSEPGPWPEFLY